MANKGQENLIPMNERSKDEVRELGRKGGIASGKTRREKATFKKTLELMLDEVAKIEGNDDKLTYRQLATLGLLKGAIEGKAENYKTALQVLGELQEEGSNETPSVQINIVDNSNLEGVMYDKDTDKS